ncbi:MAG: prepilin-type N-terminal cleavage/methylation domain-containing protein [Bacteroidota bacterium]|nr:prepilin-type N-terminal cleavage/methylation domain-containing protein [Bacteroidota bacterium]
MKKAFTLIEILVASTIFAAVMIIVSATVSQGGSYYSKIKTQREASEETRKLADLISRDIRAANSNYSVFITGGPIAFNFKNGLAILTCTGSAGPCTPKTIYSPALQDPFNDSGKPNVLVVAISNGNFRVYVSWTVLNRTALYYKKFDSAPTIDQIVAIPNEAVNQISNRDNNTKVNFGGFCPDDDSNTADPNPRQPYVQFFITAKTKDFDLLPVQSRARAEIRSMVTSRSYN